MLWNVDENGTRNKFKFKVARENHNKRLWPDEGGENGKFLGKSKISQFARLTSLNSSTTSFMLNDTLLMTVVHVDVDHLIDDVYMIDIVIHIALLQSTIGLAISIVIGTNILLIFVKIVFNLLSQNVVNNSNTILDRSQVVL